MALLVGAGMLAALPSPVLAQQPGGGLEEIVVTAQFRQEQLQTTPIAITAFTADNLEARGINTVTDLDAMVPNTVIQPLGAGWGATLAAFIRGVGLGDNILSFEPGVPIYVDDVYMGRPQGAIFDLLDLERVEVLRGPQGTLFGKNAVGGTVRLISSKPSGDGSGHLSVTIGSYNRIDARASADVTLVENRVFGRFAFSSKKADGFFKVLDYECVNGPGTLGNGGPGFAGFPGIVLGTQVAPGKGCTVDTLNDENVQSARAAFRIVFSDAVELGLIGDVTNQRQKGPGDKYTVIDGTNGLNAAWNSLFVANVYGNDPNGNPIAWDSRFVTNDLYSNYGRYGYDPLTHRNVPNINDLNHWGVSATLEWKITDAVNLKSVTAYRRFWNNFGRDSDGSPLLNNATYDESTHRQTTEEIQLTGTAGGLDWAGGFFYYDAYDTNRGFDILYPTFIYEHDSYDRQTTKNWALFAQGTYKVTDKLSATLGARYTDDKKDATVYRADFPEIGGAVVIDNQYVPTSATNTDYTVGVDYRWTDTLMTYLKYSTGFKGGGFSPRPATPVQTQPFKPEKLKTLEAGAKSEFMNRRVRLNGAIFYSDYIDQQTFAQQCEPGTGGAGQPACINWFREMNAGKAHIWGLEAELQAEPVDHFRIDASFGYLGYDLYDNQGNNLLFEGSNCGGEQCYPTRTPKYNGGIGAQYAFVTAYGSLTPRLDAQYQSKIYFNTNNTGVQDAYTLLNGRLTWQTPDDKWEMALYGQNLTDKGYFNGKLSLIGFFGREQGNPGAPRTWGLTFTRNFH